jgi:hypothetical protein
MLELVFYQNKPSQEHVSFLFNYDGTPSETCNRPVPSKHLVSLFDGNKTVLFKQKGILPKQKHPVAVFFTEKDLKHHEPDRLLPETISMQYGKLNIQFKKVQYIPMRDVEKDRKHCMVYMPVFITGFC